MILTQTRSLSQSKLFFIDPAEGWSPFEWKWYHICMWKLKSLLNFAFQSKPDCPFFYTWFKNFTPPTTRRTLNEKKTTYKHFQNFFDNLCIFSQKLWTSQLWLKKKFYMIWPNIWDVTMWHISFIIQTQVSCRIKFGFARPTSVDRQA